MKPVNAYLGYDPTRVSRISEIDSTIQSWESVLFQQGKSVMDFDLNVLQNILRNSISTLARSIFDGSGFLKNPLYTVEYSSGTLTLPVTDVNLNGRTVKICKEDGSESVTKTLNSATTQNDSNFYWIEFWYQEIAPVTVTSEIIGSSEEQVKLTQVNPYGGEDNPTISSNPYNNILDPIFGSETSRRVQLRWRLRSTMITGSNAGGFGGNASGTYGGNGQVLAQGGRISPVSDFTFYRASDYTAIGNGTTYAATLKDSLLEYKSLSDNYLYVAGRGTAADAKALNTVDGRVYGLQICMVSRATNGWTFSDLMHVVGLKTGSVIAGGSASIGTHVQVSIQEGYSGLGGDGSTLWDRMNFTTSQTLLGRPSEAAHMYMLPYDVAATQGSAAKLGYVIPTRASIADKGSVTIPSLTFESSNASKTKQTGFSFVDSGLASTTDAINISILGNQTAKFFRDVSGQTGSTTLAGLENVDATSLMGLAINGSSDIKNDLFVGRRLIAGYDVTAAELSGSDLSGGSGLDFRMDGSTNGNYNILDGGSNYVVGDSVDVYAYNDSSYVTKVASATIEALHSGKKVLTGTIASTALNTIVLNSSNDASGIASGSSIRILSGSGRFIQGTTVLSIATNPSSLIQSIVCSNSLTDYLGNSPYAITFEIDMNRGASVGSASSITITPVVSGVVLSAGRYRAILTSKYKLSRIRKLRSAYIDARKAIIQAGIINGSVNQDSGVDITGNINANARLEFRIDNGVASTVLANNQVRNAFPKTRTLNFKTGPLINLRGELNSEEDIYSLTISGSLDSFNNQYDSEAPSYFFSTGRLYDTAPSINVTKSGLPAGTTLANPPFNQPAPFTITIKLGIPGTNLYDREVTTQSIPITTTLVDLATAMQNAVTQQTTLMGGSTVSISSTEIKYSNSTGFSFDTKSSAAWKSFTSTSATILQALKIITSVSANAFVTTNGFTINFPSSFDISQLTPGMIVSDSASNANANTKLVSNALAHALVSGSMISISPSVVSGSDTQVFQNTCTITPIVLSGKLTSNVTVIQGGAGYRVGDILAVVDNYGAQGKYRVTQTSVESSKEDVRITSSNVSAKVGAVVSLQLVSEGFGYLETGSAIATVRQDYITVAQVNVGSIGQSSSVILDYAYNGASNFSPTETQQGRQIALVFTSSITNTGPVYKNFVNSGDVYLSNNQQVIRNDQTGLSNYMKNASIPSDVWVEGRSNVAARRDHRHLREGFYSGTPTSLPTSKGVSAALNGTSLTVARGDHTHNWPEVFPSSMSIGGPQSITDGGVVGTGLDFFGATGPAGKQLTNLKPSDITLRTSIGLQSAIVLWDTDAAGLENVTNRSEFTGYISGPSGSGSSGNILTITGGNRTALEMGSIISTVSSAVSFVVFGAPILNGQGEKVGAYLQATIDNAISTVSVSIGSSISNAAFAAVKINSAGTILPDVGGRIAFGGKVTSEGTDYAVFGAVRGGKVNSVSGDRNGYLSLEARVQDGGTSSTQLRYMKEFLRGYYTGAVIIGEIPYGAPNSAIADMTIVTNLTKLTGKNTTRLLRVTGASLFDQGIQMNSGQLILNEVTTQSVNTVLVAKSPQIVISGSNNTVQPAVYIEQRSDAATDQDVDNVALRNRWASYLTGTSSVTGTGHYTISLDSNAPANFEGIAMQFQRSTVADSSSGTLVRALISPSVQIGSYYNSNQTNRNITFQTRFSSSSNGGMNWKITSDNSGALAQNNYATRSFSISAVPLQSSSWNELSGGATETGRPGQPGKLLSNFQTWSFTDYVEGSGSLGLSYAKRTDFNSHVTINGTEVYPWMSSSTDTFLNTSPVNIFEVYQGTTEKPWRIGTKSTILQDPPENDGSYKIVVSVIANNTATVTQTGTRLDGLSGVYGFYSGQKVVINSVSYTISSVNYVLKTITFGATVPLNGTYDCSSANYPGGLKGFFDSSSNSYSLSFVDRADKIYNTSVIEAKDFYFKTGIDNSTLYGGNTAASTSKLYLSADGKLGLRTTSPYALMQVNNKAAHDAGYVFDTYMGEGYGSSQNSTIYPVAALSPNNGIGIANAIFVASIYGSTMTVASVSSGAISVGMTVSSSSTTYGIITSGSGTSYTITGSVEPSTGNLTLTGTLQVSVNTTINSPIVTVANVHGLSEVLAGLSVGQLVKYSSGGGNSSTFPSGTAIIKIDQTTITLSQNATTTSTYVFIKIGYSLPLLVTDQFPASSYRLNDFKPIVMLQREGTANQAYAAAAALSLSRYEASGTNSRTRLDISLAHASFTDVTQNTIMTIQSNGFVGIGGNIQRLGGLSSGPVSSSATPWTTLAVTRTTGTQDDRYGIIHATTNIGSTTSSSNASITAANYYSTAQLMAFSSTGTKIGNGRTNNTGHLWITYANSVTGLYIHGSTTGNFNDSNGNYYKSGWIAISAGSEIVTPNGPLHIYETQGQVANKHYGSLVIEHANSGSASGILFKSGSQKGTSFGAINFRDSSRTYGYGLQFSYGNLTVDTSGALTAIVNTGTNAYGYMVDDELSISAPYTIGIWSGSYWSSTQLVSATAIIRITSVDYVGSPTGFTILSNTGTFKNDTYIESTYLGKTIYSYNNPTITSAPATPSSNLGKNGRIELNVEVPQQDDNFGIVSVYSKTSTNVSLTVSNGLVTNENGVTGQFMAEGTNGLRIGNRIVTGTNLGNLYLTYANDTVGQFVQGLNTGTLFAGDGTYHRAGWTGIGTLLPTGLLHLYEPTGTANSPHYGTLVLEHGNAGGASSIVFKSSGSNNLGSDYGYIQYQSASTVGTGATTEKSRLIIGVQNDARPNTTVTNTIADDIVLSASGAIVGTGSGVAGLFAPRVSIPAQSFVAASEGSNGENSPPAFSYWVPGSTYGNSLTRGGWNRFELKYAPDSIMSADATIHLPQNFSPNAVITFKILWYRDPGTTLLANNSSNKVVWKVSVLASTPLRKQSNATYSNNGDDNQPRSNSANATLTALTKVVDDAPNDIIGEFSYVESIVTWTPTSSSAPIAYPGDILGVRLTRLATDNDDTYAGTVVFNNMVVEFGAIAPDGMSG